ncbi:MAG: transposase [Candidatus Zixiibacteriota bacterium]|nr:MAG: transposase [candidate division Zixibacteria bacterium]
MPKLRHYDDLGTARFVTICCYRMEKYLVELPALELMVKHIDAAREQDRFKLAGYVIMPEHVHLVLIPPDGMKLGYVIGEMKSRMAREYFSSDMDGRKGENVFWQKRCYDHNCRSVASVREKINYCHNNPVRRGLVSVPGEYEWSSYNWYQGIEDVPLRIDDCDFR